MLSASMSMLLLTRKWAGGLADGHYVVWVLAEQTGWREHCVFGMGFDRDNEWIDFWPL